MDLVKGQLSAHEICIVCPESFPVEKNSRVSEFSERFGDHYFRGIDAYNRLLKSIEFYERFETFDYILICQLDCLVLKDELKEWMTKGYDYIGAPFFKPKKAPEDGLWRVGNGGFSLRKVSSHLRVLRNQVLNGSAYRLKGKVRLKTKNAQRELGQYERRQLWYKMMHPFAEKVTVEQEAARFQLFEDLFWSFEAPKFDASFKVPSPQEALPFAFEVAPRWCYEKNKRRLPFGCHAWAKYDRGFWEEHVPELKNASH